MPRRGQWQLGRSNVRGNRSTGRRPAPVQVGHSGALADALFWKSYLERLAWRASSYPRAAEVLETRRARPGLVQYLNGAELHSGWGGAASMTPWSARPGSTGLGGLRQSGCQINLGFYNGLLARLEAETPGADSALARYRRWLPPFGRSRTSLLTVLPAPPPRRGSL